VSQPLLVMISSDYLIMFLFLGQVLNVQLHALDDLGKRQSLTIAQVE